MCGLGRHGHGCCFLTRAWDLDADAVTFGKAVASGTFPLSGVILRSGASELREAGKGVMHMHTYAGSGQLALLAAAEVLKLLPSYHEHVAAMGNIMQECLERLQTETDGFVRCQGQGLMWGCIFSGNAVERCRANDEFRSLCVLHGVWPYFVPAGGFQITPVLDVTEEDLMEGLGRIEKCVRLTMAVL